MMKYFILISLTICFSCNNEKKEPHMVQKKNSIGLSGVQLEDFEGKKINMAQYDGKTVFINFWATWCKPCVLEMPSLQRTKNILKNENIEFLFASDETGEQIANFNKDHLFDFNFMRVNDLAELNIMALPTTFIFNPRGKLVFNEMGYRQWDDKSSIELIRSITKEK